MRRAAALLAFLCATASAGDGFARWWPGFQAAVARDDVKAIVDRARFPMHWELGSVREIETREVFAARFRSLFTADMKRAVAHEKPVPIPEGYMITWHARGNEYSLYFHASGSTFALAGLSEGPP